MNHTPAVVRAAVEKARQARPGWPVEIEAQSLAQVDEAVAAARRLGSTLHDPFMAMSFLALEVIPTLKLTDQGLIDAARLTPVPLWVPQGFRL